MRKRNNLLLLIIFAMIVNIPYNPTLKQNVFHASGADECFFGGAKGPGKSLGLVMDATAYALQYPGSDPHLFREDYDSLEANLIKELHDVVPKDLYTYNDSKHQAKFHNGSVLKFRHVARLADAMGYDGRSIPYLGIDELTKHPENVVQQLLSCNRCAKGWPVRFRATGNPGGIGHVHVKKRYILPTEYGKHTYVDPVTESVIEFIQASVYDGVLTNTDPKYVKRLENLPEMRKRALLYGDWDIFEGQYFSNFGPHLYEEPFFIQPHIGNGHLYGSMDYGYGLHGHSSFGLWYLDPAGVPHRLMTWYRTGMTATEQADDLFDAVASFYWTSGVLPTKIWCDHNMFNTPNLEKQGEKAPIDYFKEKFGARVEFVPAIKNRINGWQLVLDYFQPDVLTQLPKMKVWTKFNGTFIEYFPQMVHDENNPDDVLKCDIDHVCDEGRYGLVGLRSINTGIKTIHNKPAQARKQKRDVQKILAGMSCGNTGF